MAEQNSISTLLPELLRLFNNSMEGFEKVNEAITSNSNSVTVNLQNDNGTVSRITIPSFGFLKNSVDRLDQNIENITNINGGGSSVRLSDGTFRKLVLAKLPSEAADLTDMNSVNEFNIKPNWFFEELINPLLYVSFDITGQAPIDTERAIVQRYILDTNSQSKINFFNNTLNGKSDIVRDTFLEQIVEKNISYVLDEAVVDLPPREKRYFGNFSVLRISDIDFTEEVNGVSITTQKKLFKLNKLSYSDSRAGFEDTVQIKIGDSLEVISTQVDTRYIVKSVDSSTNSVILELAEGVKPIEIGSNILKISSTINNSLAVDVTVGFSERCVTFIKPIDPDSKIPSVNWSPGSAFFTNDLQTTDESGNQQTLESYYQQSAIDFGRFLLSFAQDKFPSSKEGLVPNPPSLNADNFKVSLVNGQVSNSNVVLELKDLNNQKTEIEAKLKELDSAISQSKNKIQSTNYATQVERDADKNALQGLITDRSSQAELYSSVVKEISAKAQDNSAASVSPKYRARGFWAMPQEKSSPSTGAQAVVKFKVRYRYLSQEGAANPVEQFEYNDGTGTSQAAFSSYNTFESVIRPREKNAITGLYEWAEINDDNADAININQLDIPIRKGEQVEVQVKSVSEAGWPANPLESGWSDAIRIEFPADLSSDNAVQNILEQNRQDLAKVNLDQDLNSKGVIQHVASSFTANEKYFAHPANVIASGFLSENQTPVDLFSKLTEMQARLDEFSEILRNASGELVVTLVDDQGNVISLNRDSVTKVFGGFYSQEVSDLDDPRGAIISKTFFINIANAEQTGLRLISRIAGSRVRMVKQSESPSYTPAEAANGEVILPATYSWLDNSSANQSNGQSTYQTSDSDYNTIRKYDLSPILLTNPTVDVSNKFGQTVSLAPFQSTQNKNQFIYSRFNDVSSEESFYSYRNGGDNFTFNLDTIENYYLRTSDTGVITPSEFIWGGGFDATGNPTTAPAYALPQNDETVELHISHPWLTNFNTFKAAYELMTGDTATLSSVTLPFDATDIAPVLFRQSRFIPLKSDETRGKQQAIYLNENPAELDALATASPITFSTTQVLEASPTLINIPALSDSGDVNFINYSRNAKTSFDNFDQFLLGKNSCGAYLFISTDAHETIQVTGDSTQSSKIIQNGNQNSLNIPIVFQYRMTDYYGTGPGSSGGLGNIAGDVTGATTNLTYAKKIGFDIFPNSANPYQYDIEVFAKYRSDNLNIDVFPSATVTKGLSNLEQVITQLRPSVTATKVNQVINSGGADQTGLTRGGTSQDLFGSSTL